MMEISLLKKDMFQETEQGLEIKGDLFTKKIRGYVCI